MLLNIRHMAFYFIKAGITKTKRDEKHLQLYDLNKKIKQTGDE